MSQVYHRGRGPDPRFLGRDPRREGHAGQYPPNRERSRDGRFPGGQGGRGGRNTRDLYSKVHRVPVTLNMFKLSMDVSDESTPTDGEWVQYVVEISDAVRRKKRDSNGNVIEPWEFETIPKKNRDGGEKKVRVDDESTPLSRRILMQLQKQLFESERVYLVSDGSAAAYAPRRIFSGPAPVDEASKMDAETTTKNNAGVYGPADDKAPVSQTPKPETSRTYEVRVKQNCDETEPMADRVPNSLFLVKLKEVGTIPFQQVFDDMKNAQKEIDQVQRVNQCVDTMVKSAMMASCIAPDKSPKMFYLPEKYQHGNLLGRLGSKIRYLPQLPLVGITQIARFCQGGNAFLKCDTGISWFDREFDPKEKGQRTNAPLEGRIPLLDENEKTIAGVKVGNLHTAIENPETRKEIGDAIRKICFHVIYTREKSSPDWFKRQREKGKTDEQIQRNQTFVRRNLRMVDGRECKAIVWVADDETQYSFEETFKPRRGPDGEIFTPDPVKRTVASYYLEKYGIRLRYPSMPIIHTRIGYFPVEFLFQAFGKAKDANSPSHVTDILGFNDEFNSTNRIKHISDVREALGRIDGPKWLKLPDLMRQFNLRCSKKPVKLTAKLLPVPKIKFRTKNANLVNGSWTLRGEVFSSPADLSSFVVVDFCGGSSEQPVKKLLQTSQKHGMLVADMCFDPGVVHDLTISDATVINPREIERSFNRAIKQARDFWLQDTTGRFAGRTTFFKTRMTSQDGDIKDCLVMFYERKRAVVLDPNSSETDWPTHWLKEPGTGNEAPARVVALVKGINDNRVDLVDLFYLHWSQEKDCHERWDLGGGRSARVHFLRFVWCWNPDDFARKEFIERSQFESCRLYHEVEDWQIECPAVVFVYLPKHTPEEYHVVKFMSSFRFGVQSQVLIKEKHDRQGRGVDQYLSNVALKLNTKLHNVCNGARAWGACDEGNTEGIPWIKEVPTLVLGIGLVHSQGQGSHTVIGASVCLDSGCLPMAQDLRIQSKTDVVTGHVMKEIVKSLAIQFYKHTQMEPMRVLVYRDGASDGSFNRVCENELASMRKAFHELNSTKEGFACPNSQQCQGKGCVFCTPPITFVVCQSDHNIRMTPQDLHEGKDKNVPSGTCLDDECEEGIMAIENGMKRATIDVAKEKPPGGTTMQLLSDVNDQGYDFLLTAQGGLKGTSRAVLYRVLLNENAVWKPNDKATALTKEKLELCTYHMSYNYGTATKAVRSVPVVHYSKRLANTALGYFSFMEKELRKKGIDDTNYEYVRTGDVAEQDVTAIEQLLPGFGPIENRLDGLPWRPPFRPHISG